MAGDRGREQLDGVYRQSASTGIAAVPILAGPAMEYRQCGSCGYWLPESAARCDDCGAGRGSPRWLRLMLLGGLGQGTAVGWLVGSQLPAVSSSAAAALGALFGTLVAVLVATALSRAHGALPGGRGATQRREAALTRGLAEIGRARTELSQLRAQAVVQDEGAEAAMREMLATAEAALDRAELTQRIELARVELIRWRNRLAPFSDLEYTTADDRRFDLLVALRDQGARLLTGWVAADIGARGRGRELIASLQSTLQDCERLVTRCVAVRAQQVLDGVVSQLPALDTTFGDERMRDRLAGVASLAPDELREVQHAIDRIAAAEELRSL